MASGATKWKVLGAIALTVIIADQWTKLLAVEHLTPGLANAALAGEGRRVETYEERGEVLANVGFVEKVKLYFGEVRHPCDRRGRLCPEIKSIDGFWSWRYAENTGAAWSILAGQRFVLLTLSLLALVFLGQFIRKLEPGETMLLIALSLVLGGAIGNMIDRLYLEYVVDFILWYYGDFYWPTFNVADAAITTGLGLIGLNMLLEAIAKHKNSDAPNGSVAPQ